MSTVKKRAAAAKQASMLMKINDISSFSLAIMKIKTNTGDDNFSADVSSRLSAPRPLYFHFISSHVAGEIDKTIIYARSSSQSSRKF